MDDKDVSGCKEGKDKTQSGIIRLRLDSDPMFSAGYNDLHYNRSSYGPADFGSFWSVRSSIGAKIVRKLPVPEPIMDTLARGLAQRFNWLQLGIRTLGLKGNIDLARGSTLDDTWGRLYDLPRLPDEPDWEYRSRLRVVVPAITGSGSVEAIKSILNFMVGIPPTSPKGSFVDVTPLWPCQVIVTSESIDTLRMMGFKTGMIESVLPKMIAAGVTYKIQLPYQDSGIQTAVWGSQKVDGQVRAALQASNRICHGVGSNTVKLGSRYSDVGASVQVQMRSTSGLGTTARSTQNWYSRSDALVQGAVRTGTPHLACIRSNQYRPWGVKAALASGIGPMNYSQRSAASKVFETPNGFAARVGRAYLDHSRIKTVISQDRSWGGSVRIRCRIAPRRRNQIHGSSQVNPILK